MLKLLFCLFLLANSVFGLLFYEDTVFGDFLLSSESITYIFVILNFIISNLILMYLRVSPFATIGTFFLLILLSITLFLVCLFIPYWIIFVAFDFNIESFFFWTIYFLAEIGIISIVFAPIFRGLLDFLMQLNEAFFEGLKENAINNALGRNKQN